MLMKTRHFLCLLALVVSPAFAQEPPDDPKAGVLVDCGGEKVAIFDGTESKDGHFALGWTIRPNRKKDPVDWSVYHRESPLDIIEKYNADAGEEPAKADYLLVNGVLDLPGKTFTSLPATGTYFPNRNRWGIGAAWPDARAGGRYALVGIEGRFATDSLFLVHLGAGAPQVTALSPEADKAVKDGMKKRDPKDFARYETSYDLEATDAGKPGAKFQPDSVTVHFETAVPKSEVDMDAGSITFAIPKGNVQRIVFDKKEPARKR